MCRDRSTSYKVLSRGSCLALLLALSACQAYWPKSIDPQATASSFGRRRLDDPALRSAMISAGYWKNNRSWPPSPWRLRELQGAALLGHPEIGVAKAKAASARASIGTANTAPNPGISLSPELGQGTSPWVLGLSFDWQVETANKRGERTAKAQAESNAAALSIADTAWSVSSGVRAALLDLETATRRLEILEAQRENDTTLVTMVSARVTAGEAPRTDLSVYLSQQSRDLVDLADGHSKLESARAKLASAVGIPASALQTTAVSFGSLDHLPSPPAESKLRRAALLQRSDILGALQDYAATDAALRLEIARQTPDLHLNPGYTFDQGQSKWALGVGLTLPIDRNAGPIHEAIAKRDESAAVFQRLQSSIRGELDQSLTAYRADCARLHEVDSLLATQKQQLADAERMTKAGETSRLMELGAKSLVLQASLARVDALYQAQQSLGHLEDSAHLSLDEP